MLSVLFAHAGAPPAPGELWASWNLDPLLVSGLVVAAVAYGRGRRPGDTLRTASFAGALGVLALALVSPLDALSGALASAHMVQHILLVLVAAPLLALSVATPALLRGGPVAVRRTVARAARPLRPVHDLLRPDRHPVAWWLAHVATLWFWHAAVPYDAAVANGSLHILEHATFLVTGVLFWSAVIGGRQTRRVPEGFAILLVFAMAMQSVFLSALITFAREPWYTAYARTTEAYGLNPLADQQLAGVIMWIPAGLVYLAAGLALTASWLRTGEREAPGVPPAGPAGAPTAPRPAAGAQNRR